MSSLNKVFLVGRLGQDVELRYTANQKAVGNLSVATSEFKTVDGQKQESTTWHRIVVWDKTAENCSKYLHKGSKVLVEGRLQTRSWEKDGAKQFVTKVVASNVQFLDSKPSGDVPAQSQPDAPANTAPPLDEIPF